MLNISNFVFISNIVAEAFKNVHCSVPQLTQKWGWGHTSGEQRPEPLVRTPALLLSEGQRAAVRNLLLFTTLHVQIKSAYLFRLSCLPFK